MSGARAKAGEIQEKLLIEISGKMTMLISKLDAMTCGIRDLLNTVKLKTYLIKTLAERRTETIPLSVDHSGQEDTFRLLREMNDIQASMLAQKQKDVMAKMWKRQLNERKQAFWNMTRCKILQISTRNGEIKKNLFSRKNF